MSPACCWLALLLVVTGCQSSSAGPFSRWRTARDNSLVRPLTDEEKGYHQGFFSRFLGPRAPAAMMTDNSGLIMGSNGWAPVKPPPPDPVAQKEFESAELLFQQGLLSEAESNFRKISRKRKDTLWGEKAQFYLAESQFQQGELAKAHDSYEKLIADYPGTRFLETAVSREYSIADKWLASLTPGTPKEEKPAWTDRFTGRHPLVDTSGHALATLEHVRHHDPLGPLADDAVLRIANYHYNNQNYGDASVYFDQLIADHPKSSLLPEAHQKSIDAKLLNYIGPEYDGTDLEQARRLVLRSLELFPERQAQHSDELYQTLSLIDEQLAEREFHVGEHYLWTGKLNSAEYCFGKVAARWPKSPWAAKAKEQLASLKNLPRKETKASTILTAPGAPDPFSGGITPGTSGMSSTPFLGGMGGMGGAGP